MIHIKAPLINSQLLAFLKGKIASINHNSLIELIIKKLLLHLQIQSHKHNAMEQCINKCSTDPRVPQKIHLGSPCHLFYVNYLLLKSYFVELTKKKDLNFQRNG
jgi:hypothetical protein